MPGNLHATIHTRDGEGNDIEVDTREENDYNIIENEGINRFIHNTFVATYENAHAYDIYENIHDVLFIDNAQRFGLCALLLLVNLKVINGISNT